MRESVPDEERWRRVRLGFAGVTAASASVVVLFVDGRAVAAGPDLFGVIVSALWALPLVWYVRRVRTHLMTALMGPALLLASSALLVDIYTSSGSTAAVGLLFAPVYLALLVALGIALDTCARHLTKKRGRA